MNKLPRKRKIKTSRFILLIGMLIVLIVLVIGAGWFFVEYSKPADTKAPIITFSNDETVELKVKDGVFDTDDLFTIEDDSEVTVDKITPALDTIEDGEYTICVTASDSQMNSVKTCSTLNIVVSERVMQENKEFESIEDLVTAFMKERRLSEDTFGFFYYSFDDKERYVYNGDGVFNAASTIKVPLNMLYYDRIYQGEINANTGYTLTEADIEDDWSMTSNDYKVGQIVPLSYLLEESIIDSDNTATNILIRGLGGFARFRTLLDPLSEAPLPKETYSENITSPNYMLDVLMTLYQGSDKYIDLISHMKKAAYGEYLQGSTDDFSIAQKYGDFDGFVHAMGIVYTPKPYIVGVFTYDVYKAESFIKELNEYIIKYQLMK